MFKTDATVRFGQIRGGAFELRTSIGVKSFLDSLLVGIDPFGHRVGMDGDDSKRVGADAGECCHVRVPRCGAVRQRWE